ncbi:MAG TPA: IS4 family transposase [Candidatus Acidoferrum sp.]|nr:IS4 family transposase [Candidatus Acidoferrum sp.]
MQKRSQFKRGASRCARSRDSTSYSDAPVGLLAAWNQLLAPAAVPTLARRRGRKPRVPLTQLLPALIFHFMNGAGTLGQHFFQLFKAPLADSSWSDRRTRLPWQVFAELMQRVLRPLARRRRHPDAFWRDWRVLALDGTQFSLTNTPQIKGAIRKAKSRRGRAAFAKLTTGVLLEIGLHNPLAAAIGRQGQSEWELACGLLARLPKGALLLADRLHGCAAFAAQALAACARVGSHFLFRARSNVQVRVIKRFKDGSRLIRVAVRQKGNPNHFLQWLELREIRVRVGRKGYRTQELRLWTSLLEWRKAPALELAQLYAQRWEHELYYRQLKRQVRKTEVLQSHTVETAAQEIAALVLISALVAAERARAAAGQVPVLRVSFIKVLELLQPLWLTLELGDDLLSERQKNQLVQRFYEHMSRCITPKRRSRSCPRAVRQPLTGWPRLQHNDSVEGPLFFKLL